jgi:hypothetical protein
MLLLEWSEKLLMLKEKMTLKKEFTSRTGIFLSQAV